MRSLLLAAFVASCLLGGRTEAQEDVDFSILTQPAYADQADLTDEQRAAVARILDRRVSELVRVPASERDQIVARSNAELAALLTDEQKQKLQAATKSGKLQFNFHGQKWSDVLQWFAQQSGLSLVMDSEPPGRFTYNDTKEFTPTEAIDLLNSILLSKKFTLIRRERMLALVNTADGIPFDLVPQIELEELEDRGRFEIVTVKFPIGAKPMDQILKEVEPLVGEHGRVTPMTAAKQLLVTETGGKLRAINILIASIPEPKKPAEKPKPPAPIFETYPATGLAAEATTEALKALFPDAKIQFDPNAEVVHAFAVPQQQSGIKSSLERMVGNVTGENKAELQTYRVAPTRLTDLTTQLKLAHPQLQISPDEKNGRILVVADAQDQTDVKRTLEKLGAIDDGTDEGIQSPTVVLYQVDADSSESMTKILQGALPNALIISDSGRIAVGGTAREQFMAQSTIEQFTQDTSNLRTLSLYPLSKSIKPDVLTVLSAVIPKATVTQIDDGKRLSVVATATEHEMVRKTLADLDDTRPTAEQSLVKIYRITETQKSRFEVLRSDLGEELRDMRLQIDAGSLEIVASGTETQHGLLEQLLTQLESDRLADDEPSLRVYSITAAQKLRFEMIRDDLGDEFRDMRLDIKSDELIAWGSTPQHESLVRLLSQLKSTALPGESKSLQVYRLNDTQKSRFEMIRKDLGDEFDEMRIENGSDNSELLVWGTEQQHTFFADLLTRLKAAAGQVDAEPRTFKVLVKDPGELLSMMKNRFPDVEMLLNEKTKTLFVWSAAEKHSEIGRQFERISATMSPDEKDVLIAYDLDAADAEAVAATLTRLEPNLGISADTRANRILATAPIAEQPRIRALIEQLDAEPDNSKVKEVRSYPFRTLDPQAVVGMLQPLFPEMSLTVDQANRQLVASGKMADHEELSAAITRVDGRGDDIQTRVEAYDIGTANPIEIRNVLMQLVPTAVVSANPDARRVFVWTDDESHKTIGEAIEQFTQPSPDQVRTLKTYPMPTQVGRSIYDTIQRIVPEGLSYDRRGQRLVAWVRAEEHQTIQSVLDAYQADGSSMLRSYTVRDDVRERLTRYMPAMLPEAIVIETDDRESISIWASTVGQQQIETMIEQFQNELGAPADRFVKVYAIDRKQMSIDALIEALDDETREGISTQRSAETNSLIVRGDQQQHEALKEAIDAIVAQLPAVEDRLTIVYRFENGRPFAAAEVLRRLLPGATIETDGRSNVLVATATDEEQQRIGKVIEQLEATELSTNQTTVVYPFANGRPFAATDVLRRLLPRATIEADDDANVLVATATPQEHVQIREVIDQIENADPRANHTTEIYRFDRASAATARRAFQMMSRRARIGYDSGANVVIATASPGDHQIFRLAATQIDGEKSGGIVKVYPLDRNKIDTTTLLASLDDGLKDALSIQENQPLNSLIVRGNQRDQEQLQVSIDAILAGLPDAAKSLTTKVYPLKMASAGSVLTALQTLTPRASISADEESNTLLVTGGTEDQQRISEVVGELDVASGRQPVLRAYVPKNADPRQIYRSLSSAFRRSRSYSVTFQDEIGAILVIAPERNQTTFAEMFDSLDTTPEPNSVRQPKVYPLKNINAEVAAETITALTASQYPEPNIEFNEGGNSVVVVASETQHAQISEALERLDGDERQLEVFQLRMNDPFTVSTAMSSLFADIPESSAPSVSSDYTSNKLFVRATQGQLDQIRDLLVKLGESSLAMGAGGLETGNTRTIPFFGDAGTAAAQLQAIWPRIRGNRIQVITPSSRGGINPITPSGNTTPENQEETQRNNSPQTVDEVQLQRTRLANRLVVFQNTTRARAPRVRTESTASEDQATNDEAREKTAPSQPEFAQPELAQQELAQQELSQQELAPVVVIPGEGRITISSGDIEALDQLESLLRAMSDGESGGNNPNFSIFLLRNTGAADMQTLLQKLADDMPFQRGGLNSAAIVAEERLNALIVHGSRQAREMITDLLEVLDSQDLPDPLNVYRPELFPLRNAQAQRVVKILRNVYQIQLTSGGGRKPIQIPEGVDSSVASVLQQLNAASAGPVLSLDIDETSNSIVIRAPPELRREVREFIELIDRDAASSGNRNVRVIRLEKTKSDRMQEVLEKFILKE